MDQGSLRPRTLTGLFQQRVRMDAERVATRHLRGAGVVTTTWSEWERRSRVLACGLVRLGLEPGDRVAILASTRAEWAWFDLATMLAGGVTVPIFPTEAAPGVEHILVDSGARVVLVEDPSQAAKLLAVRDRVPSVMQVVYLDPRCRDRAGRVIGIDDVCEEPTDWLMSVGGLKDMGEGALDELQAELQGRGAALGPGDAASITYTAGTEGPPKGVVLTHGNMTSCARAVTARLPVGPEDVQLLYLPLAQPFARLTLAASLVSGFETAFARNYRTVMEDCSTFKPTFLCGVPRLFERIRQRTITHRADLPGVQRMALEWGLRVARRVSIGKEPIGPLVGVQREIAERMVMAPMQTAFGSRLRFAISGGAPLGQDTGEFFRCHGIEILEGYGMTETAACTHLNPVADNRLGSVGTALDGLQTEILADGELLVRGPQVSPGYWRDASATSERIDEDGWLHTGDLVRVTDDGYMTIADRKRDVIITANGKAISPRAIQEALRRFPLVDQVVLHGDRRPFLTALISLDREALERFASERGLDGGYEDLTRSSAVYGAVEAAVEEVNEALASHESVRKFAILATELTEEQGDLTPTRRVRRKVAAQRHRALLDSFYSESY